MRVGENSSSTGDLGHGADVGRDDGTSTRHRFKDRQPEGLVERRVHQEVRGPVELDGFFVRNSTDEDDVLGDAQFLRQLVQFGPVSLVTLGPEDDELATAELVASEPPGPQQAVTVLVAPQGRDEEHERPRDPCAATWLVLHRCYPA